MPGSWGHLARRFFWSLGVESLTDAEHAQVGELIDGPILTAFREQMAADQRHGLDSARSVLARGARNELAVAALVHDIGKRHARLGVFGRSIASALSRLRLPTFGRFRDYLDHGPRGADELDALGCQGIVVEFARHHHGNRPHEISPADWEVLIAADMTVPGPGRNGK